MLILAEIGHGPDKRTKQKSNNAVSIIGLVMATASKPCDQRAPCGHHVVIAMVLLPAS